jgi:hypothetical protein
MGIRVEWSKAVVEERDFPLLMQSTLTQTIVLFIEMNAKEAGFPAAVGITVATPCDTPWHVGEYYTEWDISQFRPYTGRITLQNE